jgi:TonB family protein
MKPILVVLLGLFAHATFAFADVQQEIKAGLLNHTVVVRGYYLGANLSFDQTGHLVSPAAQGFGPSEARIYITDVRFKPDSLTIVGRRTFPVYDTNTQQFRVALLQEDTTVEVALPTGQPPDETVPALLKEVFLTTPELQQIGVCPAEEQKQFEDELTTLNEKQRRSQGKSQGKPSNADMLSDVPEMCMPMGERAYMVRRGVHPPKALKAPDPTYAEAARHARIEGRVILFLIVDAKGRPATVYVGRSLDRDLDRAAVEAVQHWTFEPGTFKGTAIPVAINVEINFRLT